MTLELEEQGGKKADRTAVEPSVAKSLAGDFFNCEMTIHHTSFKVELRLLPIRFPQRPSDVATTQVYAVAINCTLVGARVTSISTSISTSTVINRIPIEAAVVDCLGSRKVLGTSQNLEIYWPTRSYNPSYGKRGSKGHGL